MTNVIPGHGGSYAVNDAGELMQKEAPTQDHPEGNRPRDANGKPLDAPPPAAEEKPAPAPEPSPRRSRLTSVSTPPVE